jgi:hypothetical protein
MTGSDRDPDYGELRPAAFTWRGSRFRVARVLEQWEEIGEWWNRETPLSAWRVQLQDGGVMELAKAHTQPPTWRLMAIYD